jgi:hypothetical protein
VTLHLVDRLQNGSQLGCHTYWLRDFCNYYPDRQIGLELSCSWDMDPKCIEEQFAGLSPEAVHKITCENAAMFYGLIN